MKLVIFIILLQAREIVDNRINKTEIQIMDVKIKIVETVEEYQSILKIRKSVFIEEQKISEAIEIDSNEKKSQYIIAYFNETPVGTARWRYVDREVKLERFAVLKEYRKIGIGRMLNDFILNEIPPSKTIFLNSQETAIKFYIKLGFEVVGSPFTEAGISHTKMIYSRNNNMKP